MAMMRLYHGSDTLINTRAISVVEPSDTGAGMITVKMATGDAWSFQGTVDDYQKMIDFAEIYERNNA